MKPIGPSWFTKFLIYGTLFWIAIITFIVFIVINTEETEERKQFVDWTPQPRDTVEIPPQFRYSQNWLTDSLERGVERVLFLQRSEGIATLRYWSADVDSTWKGIEYTVFGEKFYTLRQWSWKDSSVTTMKYRLNDIHPFPEKYEFKLKK